MYVLNLFHRMICMAVFMPVAVAAFSSAVSIDTIDYRGWHGCVRINDGVATVIVNPEYGGHVVYYGLDAVGENALWVNPVIDGSDLEDYVREHRDPDSGRFDIGNERKTECIHDSIWAGVYVPYAVRDGIGVSSPASGRLGVRVNREYRLLGDGKLYITQQLENISDKNVRYCFWTRTLLPAGGVYIARTGSTPQHPEGWAEIDMEADKLMDKSCCPHVSCRDGWFTACPGCDSMYKFGINTIDNVSMYVTGTYIYRKTFPACTDVEIGDGVEIAGYDNNGGMDFPDMIFLCSKFIEIEPNSPMFDIAPGKTARWAECWSLYSNTCVLHE